MKIEKLSPLVVPNKIDSNIQIVANYLQYLKNEQINIYILKITGTKERKLVYAVNPLPHSLLNFLFNFINLI